MNDSPDASYSLESILLSVLSGEASEQEVDWLRESLNQSPELREEACQFLHDDALVREICRTEGHRSFIQSCEASAPKKVQPAAHVLSYRRAANLINAHGLYVSAIAACLLVALAGYNFTLQSKIGRLHSLGFAVGPSGDNSDGPLNARTRVADSEGVKREVLGRVSGLSNVVWTKDASHLKFGDRIELGQKIELESGVVELLLSSGAKVSIEGPARFEATSALEATLELGRIAAAAPRVARGYTVLTPTAELVDIGTRFGVQVDEQGDSELHVFDGDVVARARGKVVPGELIHARENEAMRFNSSSATPERFVASKDKFTQHRGLHRVPTDLPPLPITDQLSVWYASDMCKEFSAGDRVTVWRDLLKGDNDFADDAWQFDATRSPLLVLDQAGRPALRFDGWATYLKTSPIQPSAQQTICIVCAPAPNSYANSQQGQILLKYGDIPSMELSIVKDRNARGWVWPGHGMSCVSNLRSSDLAGDRPSVIMYEYDSAKDQSRLWVNGNLEGSTNAPVPVLQSGSKYIGSHSETNLDAHFFGGLYELAIFDKCFGEQEIGVMTRYFKERYSLLP